MILLLDENSMIAQYVQKTVNYGGFNVTRQIPKNVSARDLIGRNIGIKVEYINNTDDLEQIIFG